VATGINAPTTFEDFSVDLLDKSTIDRLPYSLEEVTFAVNGRKWSILIPNPVTHYTTNGVL